MVTTIVRWTRVAMKTGMPIQLKRAIWQLANRNFFHHGTTVAATDVLGNRIFCRTDDFVQKHIAIFRMWEPSLTNYLLGKGVVDGIFIDIGANIGYFTLLASRQYSKVIAFEPSPSIYESLSENIHMNGRNNTVLHQAAIAAKTGRVGFYKSIGHNLGTSSLIEGSDTVFEANVKCGPLESFIEMHEWSRVRFIKIDVEGSELGVITSLLRVAHLLSKDVEIVVETSGVHDQVSGLIFKTLCDLGFSAFDLHSTYSLNDYLIHTRPVLTPIWQVPAAFTDCLFRHSRQTSVDEHLSESVPPVTIDLTQ